MKSENLLLAAISKCDKGAIEINSKNLILKDFVSENIDKISPQSLDFLHTDFSMDLNLYGKSGSMLSSEQLEVLLKYGFYPSNQIILFYSGYFDLTRFKLLFKYSVKIPEQVVYEWKTLFYCPALFYYLKNGGNPNIRPFLFSERYNIFHPSLVDAWIAQQEDPNKSQSDLNKIDNVVETLKQYGAEPSPYAMTYREYEEYHKLKQTDPHSFIALCQKKIEYISREMQKIQSDDEKYDEYFWAIKKFEDDIEDAKSFF